MRSVPVAWRLVFIAMVVCAASGLCGGMSRAGAEGLPVTAVFEPDSKDMGAFPLPNHLLGGRGGNHLPGTARGVASVNSLRGFSTAAPVFIPFRGTIDARSVTEKSVVLMDAAGGGAVSVDRAVVTYENGNSAIRLEPWLPLNGSSRYLVYVTDAVRARDGAKVRGSQFLEAMKGTLPLVDPRMEARRKEYEAIWRSARERLGLDRDALVQAFAFDTQPIGQVLKVFRQRAQASSPTFTLVDRATTPTEVAALFNRLGGGSAARSHVGMVFKGTFPAPRYVPEYSTAPIRFAGPDDPVKIGIVQVPFLVTVPVGATSHVPVIFYQHGSYRPMTDVLQIADAAAAAGLAMIAMDAELHGERAVLVDGVRQHSGTNLVNLDRPLALRDTWYQTYSDQFTLVRMLRLGNTRFTGGAPLLSTDRVAYMGHSMGSLLGGALVAMEPDIAVAVLNVPGGKIRTLLMESQWFNPRANAELARRGIRPATAEYDQFMWMMQTAVDDSDPFNYGPLFRSKAASVQVLIQEMANEIVMPNSATEALARSMGLTQVNTVRPVSTLEQSGWPFFGSALFQFPGGGHNTIVDTGEGPTASVHEQAMQYITTGLKGRAKLTCPSIPIPDLWLNMKVAPGQ